MKNEMDQNNLKIAFVGGGNMATALIGGLAGKLTAGENIHVIDLNPDALQVLNQTFGVTSAEVINAKIASCDVIVPVSYTHLRAHETKANLVCRLLLEKKKK